MDELIQTERFDNFFEIDFLDVKDFFEWVRNVSLEKLFKRGTIRGGILECMI